MDVVSLLELFFLAVEASSSVCALSHIMHLIEIKNTNFETQKVSES